MTGLLWLLAAVVVAVSSAWWATWTASRLDRLHHLVETAWAALDAQLVRRSVAALELASAGVLDPAASVLLADAAYRAHTASGADRPEAESALSVALRAVLAQPVGGPRAAELVADVDGAARRVVLARTFHNDAVMAARRVRRKRLVRWFRLAGNAAVPQPFEMDDAPAGDPGGRRVPLG